MKKTPSIRQRKYAFGLMNESKTKQQIALESGFSPSTARVPKLIENKLGFKLAVAQMAGEMGKCGYAGLIRATGEGYEPNRQQNTLVFSRCYL